MLTPDQIRLRLQRARECQAEHSSDGQYGTINVLINTLSVVLPDLVEAVQQAAQSTRPKVGPGVRERESSGTEHFYIRGYDGERQCPDCKPHEPCERAKALLGIPAHVRDVR